MLNTLNHESNHADTMEFLLQSFKAEGLSKDERKRVEILMWAAVVISNIRLSRNPAEALRRLDRDFDFEMMLRLVSRLEEPAESTAN